MSWVGEQYKAFKKHVFHIENIFYHSIFLILSVNCSFLEISGEIAV